MIREGPASLAPIVYLVDGSRLLYQHLLRTFKVCTVQYLLPGACCQCQCQCQCQWLLTCFPHSRRRGSSRFCAVSCLLSNINLFQKSYCSWLEWVRSYSCSRSHSRHFILLCLVILSDEGNPGRGVNAPRLPLAAHDVVLSLFQY